LSQTLWDGCGLRTGMTIHAAGRHFRDSVLMLATRVLRRVRDPTYYNQ
jgi:hypothetical protein